ncbi:MAG: DUF188 domain-containing protein [Spirochaetia bacterium]|nr:DUF188 domain-containing protein [Spirochaetia bacterium]
MMRVFVDADSCPRQIRSIIIKASSRTGVMTTFTADRVLSDCSGSTVTMEVVEPGMDSADAWIEEHVESGDLCITRDIILAAKLVSQGCTVLDDRGGKYTQENMAERLSIRNAMTEFREAGVFSEKTRPLSARDIQLFANMLDRELTASMKAGK